MERMSYKHLRTLVGQWNNSHPEAQFELAAYNDMYFLENPETHNIVLSGRYPGNLWESFSAWKSGFYAGLVCAVKEKNHG